MLGVQQRQQRVERVGFAPVPCEEQRRRVRTWLGNRLILSPFGRLRSFSPAIPASYYTRPIQEEMPSFQAVFRSCTFLRLFPAFLDRRETTMNITISGLALASVLMSVGCAQAFARHDLFERSDSRLQRALQTARRTCQEQQPKRALPSTPDYEGDVCSRSCGVPS